MTINAPTLAEKNSAFTEKGNKLESKTNNSSKQDPNKKPKVTEIQNDGQTIIRKVNQKGKTDHIEHAATQDAQEVGLTRKDAIMTTSAMASEQAAEKNKQKAGESKSPLKEELIKSKVSLKGQVNPKLSFLRHKSLKKPKTNGFLGKSDEPKKPKLGTPENPVVLDYAKMNKPKGSTGDEKTINYANLGKPPTPPKRWETEMAVKREQKLKQMANKHPEVVQTDKTFSIPKLPKQAKEEKIKKSEQNNTAYSQLVAIVHHVEELLTKVTTTANLPDELESKIAMAYQLLSEAAHGPDVMAPPSVRK